MRNWLILKNKLPLPLAIIIAILDFIWELPQNLLGLIVMLVYRMGHRTVETFKDGHCVIYNWSNLSAVSLGWYQFTYSHETALTCSHEVGHSHQSLYLGWLYLFVIGIPSIIWAGIVHPKVGGSYYRFYTEAWADRLAGIPDRTKEES